VGAVFLIGFTATFATGLEGALTTVLTAVFAAGLATAFFAAAAVGLATTFFTTALGAGLEALVSLLAFLTGLATTFVTAFTDFAGALTTTFLATGLALASACFAFGDLTDEDLIAFPLVSATLDLATVLTLLAASFFEVLTGAAATFFVAMRTFRSFLVYRVEILGIAKTHVKS
jgi:hypothetical protein